MLLAEVFDKLPGFGVWIGLLPIVAFSLFLSRVRWWAGLFVLPLSVFIAARLVGEFFDPHVGSAIRQEAGAAYVVTCWLVALFALIFPLGVSLAQRRSRVA
jgi:hypothetical protein